MFRKLATKIAFMSGTAVAFIAACLLVVVWAVTGPYFHFSNTWQLFINTLTTITTFLMVFLIQNTQTRDSKAMQLKLDELILSTKGRDAFIDTEDMSDEEIDELIREFQEIHTKQAASRTMKKLHEKIAAEHARRKKTLL